MSALPELLLLFDGDCAVCDATVQWVLDRDVARRVHFAPLQGETAAAVLARHPFADGVDSMILVRQTPEGERVSWYTDGLLGLAAVMPFPWRATRWLRLIPRFLRDPFYRAFARVRYRLFGKMEQCRLPQPEEAARFLP